MTNNQETAQLLKKVAAVFRVFEGYSFRVRAYENAAVSIENLNQPLEEIWRDGKLDSVPGLGENLVSHLSEYLSTGKAKHFESQFKKVPQGMFALMNIRGIGAITAYKIAKKFKLNDSDKAIDQLKSLIKEGKLIQIKSFKEKTVDKITKALETKATGKGRLLLSEALAIAGRYLDYLKTSPLVIEAETLGSLRRRLSTVGDIDIALSTKDPDGAMKHVLNYPEIKAIITSGDKVSHVKLKNGIEVDIKISLPENWGSLLQHYTGSKLHNIKLRSLSKQTGLSLSEYGIKKGKKTIAFDNEKSFYNFLKLDYIPPEIREDKGEIEASLKHKLPKIISEKDIKGDLHIHSDFYFPSSHDLGVSAMDEIVGFAIENNYEYIGFADHNPKFMGLSEKQKSKIIDARKLYLQDNFRACEKEMKNRTLNLLIGMEVDIRPDGSLALSDSLMEKLDYAIVSIHSSFDMTQEANTKRILNALSHKKALILGHPTGRLLNEREQISVDWEKIFEFCSKNNKLVEINAYPQRLDLPDDLIRLALNHKTKLIINTDSHAADQLSFMKYGVWQAKRGWATKRDVVNTFSFEDLRMLL